MRIARSNLGMTTGHRLLIAVITHRLPACPPQAGGGAGEGNASNDASMVN